MDEPKLHAPVFVGSREMVYQNPYQQVYRQHLRFRGFSKDVFVTDYGERVGVLLEAREGVLLTRQYRHLIGRVSWEIPGGKVEPGEGIETAARRECLEETGIACEGLQPLLMFHPGLETLHNPSHLFLCRDHRETGAALKGNEVSAIEWVPFGQCISMIASGTIVDSLSIIALLSRQAFVRPA